MFKLYEDKDEQFDWKLIGNVAKGRESLGEEMPVLVYRLMQYTIKQELMNRFSKEEAIDIFRKSGALAGASFAENALDLSLPFGEFVAHLEKTLADLKIGILKIEQFNEETGEAVLTVSEDLDCSGLPVTGETVCYYDEGFLAGVLKVYTKKDYVVTEIDCWATGSRVCRFKAVVESGIVDER